MFRKNSLRHVMTYPFVALMILVFVSTSLLSFYNSSRAAEYMAWKLVDEITARIEDKISRFFDRAHLVNRINVDAINSGMLNLDSMQEQELYFWRIVNSFDYIGYSYLGKIDGGFFGARRLANGTIQTIATETLTGGRISYYDTDSYGFRTSVSTTLPAEYDHRTRPWFIVGMDAAKPAWSPVFVDAGGEGLAVTAAAPVSDSYGKLFGVLGCSFIFSHINQFLATLRIGESGLTFIIDKGGDLIATSTQSETYTTNKERIKATNSSNLLIAQASHELLQSNGDLHGVSKKQRIAVEIQGQLSFLQMYPFIDGRGIEWFIVVVIPENDFMAHIKSGDATTILFSLIVLCITVLIGFMVSRHITKPIYVLNDAVKSIAKGDWNREIKVDRTDEVGELAESFNLMISHLKTTTVSRDLLLQEIDDREKAEEKYREIFDNAMEGIYQTAPNGTYQRVNPAFARMFGYDSPEELLHSVTNVSAQLYDNPEDRAKLIQLMDSVTGMVQNYEVPAKRKDGVRMWVSINATMIRDEHGNPTHFEGTCVDITERKTEEEARRRLEERLQQAEKMEALGTLAGGVAHDLNNVLGVIVGYSELLLMNVDDTDSVKKKAGSILQGGQRAAAIIQDLLTLARRGVSNRNVMNLNSVVLESLESAEFKKVLSYNPNIVLQTDFEPYLLNMIGSPVHLETSLINLAANAVEAMTSGGILTITTSNRYLDKPIPGYDDVREGDYIVLTVQDTGEGVAHSDIKRIFEPFYTKKVMGKKSGTGLGLAVVWGTVKDHNGYIRVESEKDKGTIFTLYFPITRDSITPEHMPPSVLEYMGHSECILVVDDVKEQRALATEMLQSLNYVVTSVSSGEEAIAYIETQQVDLIVLDMIMNGGMDGLDTYKEIVKIRPGQRAIIVSGFSESARVIAAQKLGAGAYVKKPYILEKIGIAVRDELHKVG